MVKKLLLGVVSLYFLMACSGSGKKDSDGQFAPPTASSKSETLENHPGQPLYKQHCSVCHQADGSGVPGMFPPLTESDYIQGDLKHLVGIIVQGLEGPITVKGVEYNSLMPGLPYLTDGEIAHILSYVRQSFGNKASEVSESEVAEIRKELK